jgi:hypothetical protein
LSGGILRESFKGERKVGVQRLASLYLAERCYKEVASPVKVSERKKEFRSSAEQPQENAKKTEKRQRNELLLEANHRFFLSAAVLPWYITTNVDRDKQTGIASD